MWHVAQRCFLRVVMSSIVFFFGVNITDIIRLNLKRKTSYTKNCRENFDRIDCLYSKAVINSSVSRQT